MSKKNKQRELRELVIQAFSDAKAKGKPDWRTMALSVLKNRILQRTNRGFREADYGVTTLRQLVELLPDLLVLEPGFPPSVSILVDVEDGRLANPKNGPTKLVGKDEPESEEEAVRFQELLDRYRSIGDNLGVGEAYASQLPSVAAADVDRTFVNIVSLWAASNPVDAEIDTIRDLVQNVDKFVPDLLALAVVHATLRTQSAGRRLPAKLGDVNYRVADYLRSLLELSPKANPAATMHAATAKTKELQSALQKSVERFCQSTPVAAKLPSTDVIKQAHAYRPYALLGERQTLRDVEVLLGTLFRKFCESCEKHEAEQIPIRVRDLRRQYQRTVDSFDDDSAHWIRRVVLEPVATHMAQLIEEGTRASEEMVTPLIQIVGGTFRLDLTSGDGDVVFPARVINDGDGTAHAVHVRSGGPRGSPALSASDPSSPFDLPPGTERLIRLRLNNLSGEETLGLTALLACETINGTHLEREQPLEFKQQRIQPDWDELLMHPPYAINPIRDKRNLYGRDSVLADLGLHVSNETSTFLWGQKRVGKTSVLQVLAGNLNQRGDIVCIVLRMGELVSLHEGQLAHTLATRLVGALDLPTDVPGEDEFRAGLGRLIPFVEDLARENGTKMLVIIDEFDDLNPAFYLGDRGKQFVKALRSLSEVGLTLMFVGSERMDSIYRRHSADLNKWVNSSLDRIEVEADCEALITETHSAATAVVAVSRGQTPRRRHGGPHRIRWRLS